VKANNVYQEFIHDKDHLHMNATRWVTLTEFVKHLGRLGIARVDETEKGWFIAWIDSSPKALAKQEAAMKKERATTSDEQRERMLIAEQIERAAAEVDQNKLSDSDSPPPEVGLKRDEGAEKVVLSLAPKAPVTISLTAKPAIGGLKLNPLKAANPLKRPNVFKQAASSTSSSVPAEVAGKKRDATTSAAERLISEDQERKRRRMERETAV